MRIWDISPGYLARQQLLGEHRELHGLVNILQQDKRGYANHPETKRWVGHLPALALRHAQLAAEMHLRSYRDRTPLACLAKHATWPERWLDTPARQFELLRGKYADGRSGRIPLPDNPQRLWAQHKYSVMARDPALYQQIGPEVAEGRFRHDMAGLALLLTETLRQPPPPGRLFNALQHMWGHVAVQGDVPPADPAVLLSSVAAKAFAAENAYLLESTALSELSVWLGS